MTELKSKIENIVSSLSKIEDSLDSKTHLKQKNEITKLLLHDVNRQILNLPLSFKASLCNLPLYDSDTGETGEVIRIDICDYLKHEQEDDYIVDPSWKKTLLTDSSKLKSQLTVCINQMDLVEKYIKKGAWATVERVSPFMPVPVNCYCCNRVITLFPQKIYITRNNNDRIAEMSSPTFMLADGYFFVYHCFSCDTFITWVERGTSKLFMNALLLFLCGLSLPVFNEYLNVSITKYFISYSLFWLIIYFYWNKITLFYTKTTAKAYGARYFDGTDSILVESTKSILPANNMLRSILKKIFQKDFTISEKVKELNYKN